MPMPTHQHPIAEEGLDRHPAVRAWRSLSPGNRSPSNVIPLYAPKVSTRVTKDRRKSAVFRLDGCGPAGTNIVAKSSQTETASIERTVYEEILCNLPISSPKYYGHVEIEDLHWFFVDYANGDDWQIENPAHRELAIEWLAEMHATSIHMDALSLLPRRGPDYYLSQLTTARQRMLENLSNPALDSASVRILDDFIRRSSLLESHWSEVAAFCETLPESLVHNDFLGKNIQVRNTKTKPTLLVFDWEMSGRGVASADLFRFFERARATSVDQYWKQRKSFGSSIALQDVEYLFIVGALFRLMDAVEWASQRLLTEYPNRKIHHIRAHTEKLNQLSQVLGWL
jgi:aminoglycoside phosphotransferase (APT) family kinase protein